MHFACIHGEGDLEIIEAILKSGDNINRRFNNADLTAAHMAIQIKKPKVLVYLASQPGFDPNAVSDKGISLLDFAILGNDRISESALLNHPSFQLQPERANEHDTIKRFRHALSMIARIDTDDIESDLKTWTDVLFTWVHMGKHQELRHLITTYPDLATFENEHGDSVFDMAISKNLSNVVKCLMLHGNVPLKTVQAYLNTKRLTQAVRIAIEESLQSPKYCLLLEDQHRSELETTFNTGFQSLQNYKLE
ncbi:MAG: ankyrin repeat domain-containing protein, partial [Myxococcaceae bacterium]